MSVIIMMLTINRILCKRMIRLQGCFFLALDLIAVKFVLFLYRLLLPIL